MTRRSEPEARAQRLVRCYPGAWRERYGDEFTQLLTDDLRERPHSLPRSLDVVLHGLWTRLTYMGLSGRCAKPARRSRMAVVALLGTAMLFLLVGAGVWSQLTIGWQWAPPADPGTRAAMWLMTIALGGLAVLALVALPLCVAAALAGLARGRGSALVKPAAAALGAGVILFVGCRHFGAGWPGTGGHAWPGRELVPGWIARLAWAATLWVSAYWAHPEALRAFPSSEVIWMVVSPLAWLVLIAGGLTAVWRLRLTRRLRGAAIAMAAIAVGLMGVFLAGAGSWVLSGGPGPRGLFAVGTIDVVALGALTAGLLAAGHLLHRARGDRPNVITG